MATPTPAASSERPGRGRPPRISRAMIAAAAHELGLEGLTLRAVADHLDVSISALYHHVSSKDDLMRLAAEYTAARVPLPQDHGQHWALWLSEWADYNRDAFIAHPGLLTQYLEGAISAEVIAVNVDGVLGVLVRQGFTILEADAAYQLVISCAIGTAVGAIREREARAPGQPLSAEHWEVLDQHAPDELPYLRRLHAAIADHGREPFRERVATALCGIATRQGLDWEPIRTLLDAAAAG